MPVCDSIDLTGNRCNDRGCSDEGLVNSSGFVFNAYPLIKEHK